jgi:hypothetical protein
MHTTRLQGDNEVLLPNERNVVRSPELRWCTTCLVRVRPSYERDGTARATTPYVAPHRLWRPPEEVLWQVKVDDLANSSAAVVGSTAAHQVDLGRAAKSGLAESNGAHSMHACQRS